MQKTEAQPVNPPDPPRSEPTHTGTSNPAGPRKLSKRTCPTWVLCVRKPNIILYYDLDLSIKMPIIEEEQFR